ncbi:uncharacterized protein LOC130666020 [Microplitis mediator]|uniref:uncharacterized protein LOC130666020 n=1 Tax=Microplitis mediator TaxID=375433 RepID=UPI0025561769|nr:uncharacterized protein LOC130666020 [Microplitis mediator]XP_057322642.1 uncharacterized protein LOC130666020 [Microplitis mediator]
MTAAQFSSGKSETESPLLRKPNCWEKIVYSPDAMDLCRINPSRKTWIEFSIILIIILFILSLVSPSVASDLISSLLKTFLFTIVATKGTLLSMTYELVPNFVHKCIVKRDDGGERSAHIENMRSEGERLMWIWCFIIAYTLSEFINSLMCFRKAIDKPSTRQFFSVIIPETFHTMGIALMIFEVLPKLNVYYFVLFLIWCVIEWGLHTLISTVYEIKNIKLKSLLIVADIVVLGIFLNFTIFNPFDGKNRNNSECWIAILALALIHGGLWQDVPNSKLSFTGNFSLIRETRKKLELVKDSIFAWVSLWKIIVFIATSFTIFAIHGDSITKLFRMFGHAFGDYNITLIPSDNGSQLLTIPRSLLFPILLVSFQVILSTFVNMKPDSIILRFLHGFDFRSRWGLNLPVFFAIAYLLWSEYIRIFYCNLVYNVDMAEYFTNVLTEIDIFNQSKVLSLDYLGNWEALLLKISCCWIILHFLFRSRVNTAMETEEELEKPEAKTPQEVGVYVVLENEKVEEKKKLEC